MRSLYPIVALLFILALLFTHCQVDSAGEQASPSQTPQVQATAQQAEGLRTLQTNCSVCHAAHADDPPKTGPSFPDIKAYYQRIAPTEAAFVAAMQQFLRQPSAENALMTEAVAQYGVMPNLGLPADEYAAIARVLYRAELDQPDWMEQSPAAAATGPTDYLKAGQQIALSTKAVLGKNLLSAIKTEGTAGALAFCRERAIPLTDSMATALNARVRRVSDRNRNPNNAATGSALAYIQQAHQTLAAGGDLQPQLLEADGKMIGYYPILTNEMCLQCHGQPQTDIQANTLAQLARAYPDDRAVGYGANQLRGIWVVEMER